MMTANLPASAVGLIVVIYWGRVVRLALKIRRRAAHSANVIPPGIGGWITRAIWLPVVCLWICIPLLGPAINGRVWLVRPIYDLPIVGWIAAAVALACLVFTWMCWKRMGKSWRMGIDPAEKTLLIVTGPYAHVRHPIYALSSALMLATVVADPVPLLMVVAVAHLVLLQLEARREERHLAHVHGQPYLDYCATTGRFVPRPRLAQPKSANSRGSADS
jgi:protein-S-isoprenylcysteine O-methyltransferase Ste14